MTVPLSDFAQLVDWCREPAPASFKRVVWAYMVDTFLGADEVSSNAYEGVLAYVPGHLYREKFKLPDRLCGTLLYPQDPSLFFNLTIELNDPVWIDLVDGAGENSQTDQIQGPGVAALMLSLAFSSNGIDSTTLLLQNFLAFQPQIYPVPALAVARKHDAPAPGALRSRGAVG